jgi:hypothetical protein
MKYLCSECSTQLSKFEIELNELYPVGKLYCEFCQNKHEREIIKKLIESEGETLDFYDYKKHKETLYDQKEKDYTYKGRSIGFMFSNNKKGSNEDN